MSRTVQVEYIANEGVLKLVEPLEGVEDHAQLEVEIRETSPHPDQPWMKLEGSLSTEDGKALAKAIRDAFGRDEIEV